MTLNMFLELEHLLTLRKEASNENMTCPFIILQDTGRCYWQPLIIDLVKGVPSHGVHAQLGQRDLATDVAPGPGYL